MDFKNLLKNISNKPSKPINQTSVEDEELPDGDYSLEELMNKLGGNKEQSIESPEIEPVNNILNKTKKSTNNNYLEDVLAEDELNNILGAPITNIKIEQKDNEIIIDKPKDDLFAPPSDVADTGLSPVIIQDLLLKCLFYQSSATGKDLAYKVRLPMHSVVDPLLMKLSEEKFLEVMGSTGLGGHNKTYRLTAAGYKRAEDVLKVSNYVGPAPVCLDDYIKAVNSYKTLDFTEEELRNAYKDLILSDASVEQIGPALLSGKSMFVYGPPGTGKTSIAERITRCYGDSIMVPYAVNIQGITVRFFDFFLHKPIDSTLEPGIYPPVEQNKDARWIEIKRPCILVGPEFTINSSDLQYDPSGPSYQFPSTIKANGGVFVVDDFGRQKEDPQILLNRWIIPLEKQKDILNLKTGQQISVPFKVFTVFSTNLDPKQLVDDAFLRRLAYKIKVDYPELETYCQIFATEADKAEIEWTDDILDYFIQTYYFKANRQMKACDPRDVLSKVTDKCKFRRLAPPYKLTKELLDYACNSYFVTY